MTCYRAAAEAAQQRETDAKGRVQQLLDELRDTQGQLAQRKQVLTARARAVQLDDLHLATHMHLFKQPECF